MPEHATPSPLLWLPLWACGAWPTSRAWRSTSPQGDGPPRVAPAARDSLPSLQRNLWAEVSDRRPAGDGSGNHRQSFIPDQVFRCGPTWDGTRYRNTRKWQPAHRNPEYLWGARAAGYKLLVQNIESSWTRETFGTMAMERGVPLPSDFS